MWFKRCVSICSLLTFLALLPGPASAQFLDRAHLGLVNPLIYGVALNDTTLSLAITAIGSAKQGLMCTPGTWTIANNLTIPANVHLVRAPGCILSPNITRTLTINGSEEGPLMQWLAGAGSVILGPMIPEVFPQWTGSIGDGTTNDTAAFQKIVAAISTGQTLRITKGSHVIRDDISPPSGVEIRGDGPGSELFWDTPAAGNHHLLFLNGVTGVIIRDLSIRGTNTAAAFNATFQFNWPIYLAAASHNRILNVTITDYYGNGGVMMFTDGTTSTTSSDFNVVAYSRFERAGVYGVVVSSGKGNQIIHNRLDDASLGTEQAVSANINNDNIFAYNTMRSTLLADDVAQNSVFNIGSLGTGSVGNIFAYNQLNGIHVVGNPIRDAIFIGNRVMNYFSSNSSIPPVFIQGASTARVKFIENVIDATGWTAATTVGRGAVTFSDGADNEIIGNTIFGATGHGLASRNLSRTLIKNNTIRDNGGSGIHLYLINTDITLEGNQVYDNNIANAAGPLAGIAVQGDSANHASRTVIRNNRSLSPASDKQGSSVYIAWANDTTFKDNVLTPAQSATVVTLAGTNNNLSMRENVGWVTEASGTGTITSGSTSVVITHGLSVTPAAKDIQVMPTNLPTVAPGNFYIDTFTATQFTVRVPVNPSTSGATFAWQAQVR